MVELTAGLSAEVTVVQMAYWTVEQMAAVPAVESAVPWVASKGLSLVE